MNAKPKLPQRRAYCRAILLIEAAIWAVFTVLRLSGMLSFRMKYIPLAAVLIVLIDFAAFLILYDREHRNDAAYLSKRRIVLILLLLSLVSSIPLFTDYLACGHDIQFHLFRMEGVVDGLMDGQLPVRIHPNTLYGYGYAAPSFYPEALLYFPAALRLCGFSIMGAYKTFLFALNALTAYLSYFAFSRMFRSAKLGLVGSGFYTLSLYRLINLYTRAAIGEASAMAFLPLIALGLYAILTDDSDAPGYRFAFLPLTVGMTGLVGTHLLSCEMVLPLLALVCLVCAKRTFQPKRLLAIAKAACCTLLLGACFFVPMLDYLGYDTYQVFQYSVTNRAHEAINVAQLFPLLPGGMGESLANTKGIAGEMPLGVGFVFAIILAVYPALCKRGKSALPVPDCRAIVQTGRISYFLGLLLLVLCTNLFPWEALYNLGGLAAESASMLQFPWRLLAPATVLLCIVACRCFALLPSALSDAVAVRRMLAYTLCLFALITPVAYCDRLLQQADALQIDFYEDLDQLRSVGDAEYLPFGAKGIAPYRIDKPVHATPGLSIESFSKQGTHLTVGVANATDAEATVDLPLIQYLGYVAHDDAGQIFTLTKGDLTRMQLHVPAHYTGTIEIRFVERALWRAAEAVSVLTGFALLAAYIHKRRKSGTTVFDRPGDPISLAMF